MGKIKLYSSALLSLVLFIGCLDVNMKIKVKPDGSGIVEEQVLLSDEIVEMLSAFGEVDEEGNKEEFNMYDEEELKTQALEMGKGVKFAGGEKIKLNGKQGYKALFEFTDINKIKVNQSPDSKLPAGTVDDEESEENGEFITFSFQKGNPSTLCINMPKSKDAEVKIDEDEEFESDSLNNGGMDNMFIEMMKDFRMNMELEIDGEIIETDAAFREGSKITLLLMDFRELFEMPEKLEEFKKIKPDSFESAREFFKEIPGFKFETHEKIEVKLK